MAVKTYKKGDKTKLSKNFSVYEFRCGIGRGCDCTTTLIDDQLVKYLQQIRDHFGKAVTITSAHRCESYNRSVNGAVGSRHTKGQACDIVIKGVAPLEVARYAESIGIKGIGLYDTFVHIDTRAAKSFWYSDKQYKRTTFQEAKASTPTKENSSYTLDQFVMDIQEACGATVDRIVGPETINKTVTLSTTKNGTHASVLAVQKRLKALGYDPGEADGFYGNKTKAAVIAFQKATGCYPDGIITAKNKTWKKLLGAM